MSKRYSHYRGDLADQAALEAEIAAVIATGVVADMGRYPVGAIFTTVDGQGVIVQLNNMDTDADTITVKVINAIV